MNLVLGIFGYIPTFAFLGLAKLEGVIQGPHSVYVKAAAILTTIGFAGGLIGLLVSSAASGSIGQVLGIMIGSLMVWSSFQFFKTPLFNIATKMLFYYSIWDVIFSQLFTYSNLALYYFDFPGINTGLESYSIYTNIHLQLSVLAPLWFGTSLMYTNLPGTFSEKCFKYSTKFMMAMAIISSCILYLYYEFLCAS